MEVTEHLKQNDSGLYLIIQKSGCFFRAACKMAEEVTGKMLTVQQLNSLWDDSRALRYIDENNNTMQSAAVATLALRRLKGTGRFTEVATFMNGVMGWYLSVPNYKRRADFYIQKGRQNGPQKFHFYNVDKYGTLLWDPHRPDINITSVVYTICYRYDEG